MGRPVSSDRDSPLGHALEEYGRAEAALAVAAPIVESVEDAMDRVLGSSRPRGSASDAREPANRNLESVARTIA